MTETAGPPIRLAVQSHRRLVRDALAAYLAGRPEFQVVGQTANVADLYPLCLLRRPDVVVVDAGPLTTDLVEALRALRVAFPAMEVVVAYSDLTPAATHAAIRAGLTALVPATRGLDALLNMLRRRVYAAGRVPPDGLALTDRELEIILLLAAGHSVPEMAALLEISPHTVENHKRHLYAKLGVGTRAHAVSRAAALGLTQPVRDVAGRAAAAEGATTEGETTEGDPLVLLAGAPGSALDEVAEAVAACGLTVGYGRPSDTRRGPVVAVLVDPRAGDWLFPASTGIPVVVVHTTEPTLAALADAQLRGAHAMLHRDQVPTDLATVLALVRRGYFTMSAERFAELANWMGGRFLGGGLSAHPNGLPDLTARERDILASIADGHTVRQTARVLGIAAKTVENTQARLFRKLDARNRAEALTVAYRLGLLDPGREPRDGGTRDVAGCGGRP
jgi:two-component system, NarL family, nitrate/nitrite response regulator NarL